MRGSHAGLVMYRLLQCLLYKSAHPVCYRLVANGAVPVVPFLRYLLPLIVGD
jgi:hypothetical protein